MLMIGPYVIDAALSEDHTLQARVTKFPIESGSNFADNVQVDPRKYKMVGIVSDTPLDDKSRFSRVDSNGATIVDTSTVPSAQAKTALESVLLGELPITIVTTLATYANMVMTSLTFSSDGETGDALPFVAEFEQITIVENTRKTIKVKFTALDLGNRAAHPPGWIGTDKIGRDIVGAIPGPGLPAKYFRADGTEVSAEEAAEATRRQGRVQTVFDKDGKAQLVRPGSPYWVPPPSTPFPTNLPPGFPGF